MSWRDWQTDWRFLSLAAKINFIVTVLIVAAVFVIVGLLLW